MSSHLYQPPDPESADTRMREVQSKTLILSGARRGT